MPIKCNELSTPEYRISPFHRSSHAMNEAKSGSFYQPQDAVARTRVSANWLENACLQAIVLIEAWASMKSFQPKGAKKGTDTNFWSSFKGQSRSNQIHEFRTDPKAKFLRKGLGKTAKLCLWKTGTASSWTSWSMKPTAQRRGAPRS